MHNNTFGKFLKLNSLESPIVEYQLFNFAKESLKQIFLSSKCGEIINIKDFKDKFPSQYLLGIKNIYPLTCLYKKSKPKIKCLNNNFSWKEEKSKKKIHILSNALMTLNILYLVDYYTKIIKDEKKQKELTKFYLLSAQAQLNYYLNNFRNDIGLFVNKEIVTNKNKKDDHKIIFESLSENFDFVDQAYLMATFLKCSNLLKENNEFKIPFKEFSIEILKMFIDYKNNLFELSPRKIIQILHAFNIYITLDVDINKELLFSFLNLYSELMETLIIKKSISSISTYNKILFYMTLKRSYSYFKKFIHEDFSEISNLISEFIWDVEEILDCISFNKGDIIDSKDLISYEIYLILFKDKNKAINFFNNTLLPSKVFSCFPNPPKKGDGEKYFQFEIKDSNLIPDEYFKPKSYKSMNETDLTPIFLKGISYCPDKNKFSKPKIKFHAPLNMHLIHFIISNLSENIILNSTIKK